MFKQSSPSLGRARARLLSGYFMVLAALLLTLLAPSASAQYPVNPYDGAIGFVNPQFAQEIAVEAANQSGDSTLQQKMYTVENQSTAVWLTSVASVSGLKWQIDAALSQQASQQSGTAPVVMTIVIYNLPQRDCSANASAGELTIAGNDTVATADGGTQQLSGSGVSEYEHDFIDPIYAILAQYETNIHIRFVLIIEPDSIPNLITNTGYINNTANLTAPNCVAANNGVITGDPNSGQAPANSVVQSGSVYVQGIQYDLTRFYDFLNVYQYLDISQSAWLGWPSNMTAAVAYYKSLIVGTPIGLPAVTGFISNVSNYVPTKEPYMLLNKTIDTVKTSGYYSYNPYIDEEDYEAQMYTRFTAVGFPSTLGFLIDTGRNGWGGPSRPTAVSTSTDLTTYVNQSKIDERPFRGDWCNIDSAGIGALPTVNPGGAFSPAFPHLQAYVWVKPPGETDGSYPGSYWDGVTEPNGPGFDRNCDPSQILNLGTDTTNLNNLNALTDSVQNSPPAGTFWPSYFDMLVTNADIDGTGNTLTPLPTTPASITLYATQFALTVSQGGTVTDNILASVGGYTGKVNLSAQVIGPSAANISTSFSSTVVQAPGQSTLTVKANQTTTPGHYLVKVSGLINGNVASTVSISLTVLAAPGFTLSSSSATLNVVAPTSGSTSLTDTITVTPTGGFTGNVTLSYSNLPAGVTASFSSNPTSATSTLTLTVGSTVLPGTYSILISGTSGATSSSTPITLLISPATAKLKMTASAPALSTTPGGNTVTDTITVTGYTTGVTLAASGLPSTVTVKYSSNPTTNGTSVLTFTVTGLATPGTYPITITGTSGTLTASTIISLTVAPAPVSCHVIYTVQTHWPGGFEAGVTIKNLGTATITNWKLTWTFANGQTITGPWNGNVSQSGSSVTVSEQPGQSWENIPAGEGYSGFGFIGTWNNSNNAVPTSFAVNGTNCK